MKPMLKVYGLLLAIGLIVSACGQKETAPAPPQPLPAPSLQPAAQETATTATQAATAPEAVQADLPKEINVYMYSEYIDPEQITAFEEQSGLKVNLNVYEATEDMLAKLQQAGGVSQYDVVVASDHAIPVMARLGLIQPIDAAKVPNKKNLSEQFTNPSYDPDCQYSLPYQWGTMGIMYRKDKLPELEPTWGVVFDEAKQPGPFVLIDSMRDMMAAALKYQGASINTHSPDELRQAGEAILKAKKSDKMLGFDGGVGGKNKVVAGEAVMAIAYNGDVVRAMDEDPNVGFMIPKEGTLIWMDAMTIPAQAPNVPGALEFINYILDAQAGAQLSNYNQYATPNQASMEFITPEDRENPAIYPTAQEIANMQYLEDVGNDTRLYDEVWMAVKSR